jgi:nitrogen fixation-related uncharacterized protein
MSNIIVNIVYSEIVAIVVMCIIIYLMYWGRK